MRLPARNNGTIASGARFGRIRIGERAGDACTMTPTVCREQQNKKHSIHAAVTGTSLIGWID